MSNREENIRLYIKDKDDHFIKVGEGYRVGGYFIDNPDEARNMRCCDQCKPIGDWSDTILTETVEKLYRCDEHKLYYSYIKTE